MKCFYTNEEEARLIVLILTFEHQRSVALPGVDHAANRLRLLCYIDRLDRNRTVNSAWHE